MSLLDDLSAETAPKVGGCRVCEIFADLPDEESVQVRRALRGKMISQTALARVLTKNGHQVGRTAIGRHVTEEHP